MPKLEEIGKRILLHHKLSGENHYGTVDDVNGNFYIVHLDETASHLVDKYRFVDLRYDFKKWKVVRLVSQ